METLNSEEVLGIKLSTHFDLLIPFSLELEQVQASFQFFGLGVFFLLITAQSSPAASLFLLYTRLSLKRDRHIDKKALSTSSVGAIWCGAF